MNVPVHPTDPDPSSDAVQGPRAGLEQWGYDEGVASSFEQVAQPGDRPGRVIRADSRSCVVVTDDDADARCAIASRLVIAGEQPTTGDFVVIRSGEVVAVLERRSAVTRASPDPGRGPQVLAANVDSVLVAEPLGERWRPRRLERLLVLAWQSGAVPVVVLTKADRCEDVPGALAVAMAVAPGANVHAVCPITGMGMADLQAELAPGSTAVIIGRSGAGKSTLTNALSAGDPSLATAGVRSDGKGRHTTVTRELVRLSNGALLIDTPGVRAVGLVDADEGIADAFADVEALSVSCRFRDCAHESEPGCAVTEAIASGRLDAGRLDSYRRLQREQERLAARDDPRLRAERSAAMRRRLRTLKQQPHR
jgi:ribosome biogenesis GTPase